MSTTFLAPWRTRPAQARPDLAPPVVGFVVWAVAAALLPAPLAARVLLLAPLVIVPRLLVLIPDRPWVNGIAGWPAFAAAVPLVIAFGLSSIDRAGFPHLRS